MFGSPIQQLVTSFPCTALTYWFSLRRPGVYCAVQPKYLNIIRVFKGLRRSTAGLSPRGVGSIPD